MPRAHLVWRLGMKGVESGGQFEGDIHRTSFLFRTLQLINFADRCRFQSIFNDVGIYFLSRKFWRSAEIGTLSSIVAN